MSTNRQQKRGSCVVSVAKDVRYNVSALSKNHPSVPITENAKKIIHNFGADRDASCSTEFKKRHRWVPSLQSFSEYRRKKNIFACNVKEEQTKVFLPKRK